MQPDISILSLSAHRDGEQVPEELQYVSAAVLAGSFVGFLFGGMIGARQAGDKYILLNHSTKFSSSMQAQVAPPPSDQLGSHHTRYVSIVRENCMVPLCWGS